MSNYKILPASIILEKLSTKISAIRTDRVNSTLLNNINVPVPSWGGEYKIMELATITIPESNQLLISPFDKSILTAIEKAIRDSNLGVNPNNDGIAIRLNFANMTEEDRSKKAKELKGYGEDAKVEMRSNRQNLIKAQKAKKESKEITEDDLSRFEKNLQTEVDNLTKEIDGVITKKEGELMKI